MSFSCIGVYDHLKGVAPIVVKQILDAYSSC